MDKLESRRTIQLSNELICEEIVQRFCLTLGLRNDPELIAAYVERHGEVWPEVLAALREAGVLHLGLYELEGRLCMLLEATDEFTFERKAEIDRANPVVMQWEREMSRYQQADADADASGKWRPMRSVFRFDA